MTSALVLAVSTSKEQDVGGLFCCALVVLGILAAIKHSADKKGPKA